MSTIAEKLEYLLETKELIKEAVNAKGGSLTSSDTFRSYAEAVENLETGTGSLADEFIDGSITSVSSDTVTSIANYAFYYYTNLLSASFPAVTSTGNYAFNNCSSLTSVSLPTATTISSYAFANCGALSSLTLDSVTSIGQNTFYSCTGLSELNFSESFPNLTALDNVASFAYCTGLTKVFIPSAITTIDTTTYSFAPFLNCSSSLVIYTDAEEALEGWGTYWNYRSSSTALTVHYGASEEDYENA